MVNRSGNQKYRHKKGNKTPWYFHENGRSGWRFGRTGLVQSAIQSHAVNKQYKEKIQQCSNLSIRF